jgi:predicted nucleotidyltransferase
MLSTKSIEYIKSMAERFGAEKILLFGSCLEMPEEEANDIDLVVYGLDPTSYWKMMDEMAWPDELNGKWVDLIRAENNQPVMVFASEGVPIYEREPERQIETIPL